MKKQYEKAVKDIVKKYDLKEVDEFLEKNQEFEAAIRGDKEFFEKKGMAQYMKTAVLDRMKLEGMKQEAVKSARKLYGKLTEIKPYERKLIVSHYLVSKGARDADGLLEGDEGTLEESIAKWELERGETK